MVGNPSDIAFYNKSMLLSCDDYEKNRVEGACKETLEYFIKLIFNNTINLEWYGKLIFLI